ncbi:hypothetical protein Bca4012_043168 [Brassica carinata]|uniref:Uncharacterized protein n=1 Tax=Brassica carinata TaxID=52824 RepID=A0A8X7QUR1_BRACI|nr:hypothetical protein Bca52824_059162 [Brassica carinata]
MCLFLLSRPYDLSIFLHCFMVLVVVLVCLCCYVMELMQFLSCLKCLFNGINAVLVMLKILLTDESFCCCWCDRYMYERNYKPLVDNMTKRDLALTRESYIEKSSGTKVGCVYLSELVVGQFVR